MKVRAFPFTIQNIARGQSVPVAPHLLRTLASPTACNSSQLLLLLVVRRRGLTSYFRTQTFQLTAVSTKNRNQPWCKCLVRSNSSLLKMPQQHPFQRWAEGLLGWLRLPADPQTGASGLPLTDPRTGALFHFGRSQMAQTPFLFRTCSLHPSKSTTRYSRV